MGVMQLIVLFVPRACLPVGQPFAQNASWKGLFPQLPTMVHHLDRIFHAPTHLTSLLSVPAPAFPSHRRHRLSQRSFVRKTSSILMLF